MANHRFRLSNMVPNAWFYKLRDMGGQTRRRKPDPPRQIRAIKAPPVHDESRFPFPSRRSPKGSANSRKTIYKPSLGLKEIVQDSLYYTISPCSDSLPSSDPFDEARSWSSSCSPRFSSSTADIIIDIDKKIERFDNQVGLPPILTKPAAKHKERDYDLHEEIKDALHKHHRSLSVEISNHETDNRRRRRRQRVLKDNTTLPLEQETGKKPSGVKTKGKSTSRVLAMSFRQTRRTTRRSVSSESFAVVKRSYDPEKDFRDSMVEMIVEQHIEASKDLEDLLACYLTLNSNEYHDVIVNAFEQIWCELFFDHVCTAEA